ncbi:MAG: type III-B CRISPR module-associated protein Cmr3 [Candidatus Omnitrophica bacterium]|nr:type III-B CRISPR module-associated protein Cmr3 [Candidatus Omnitrophota bacterium]
MSAGQGKGSGCRMPFPSTLHEAFRASLLIAGEHALQGKKEPGRPRKAPRRGNWHDQQWPEENCRWVASRAFRSLRTVGPLPWQEFDSDDPQSRKPRGLLLPVPLDVAWEYPPGAAPESPPTALRRLQLWRQNSTGMPERESYEFCPECLSVAVTPPDKCSQLHGWWTVNQYRSYLEGRIDGAQQFFQPAPQSELWEAEHRVGVQIDPGSFASMEGQLYAGSYLRPQSRTRFAVQLHLEKAVNNETVEAQMLNCLLLGGERRLARIWRQDTLPGGFTDPFADPIFKAPPSPSGIGPCLLKWVLVTPAIFARGSLPGWCWDTNKDRPSGLLTPGRVCFDLPGRVHLVSWCHGKPLAVSGWDVAEQRAKPTQLSVPAGSVFYFLCEDTATGCALAERLHWKPRSDFYGEKGCGYGLVSFDVQMHPSSIKTEALASEMFR